MAKSTLTAYALADESVLAARAAWLHFVGGMTQSEVAARLGISTSRAHRAIARAQSLGLVHVTVDASAVAPCVALENALCAEYGLTFCQVAMELPETGSIPLRALGALGGDWLGKLLDAGAHRLVGVSHGRTIAAAVEAMANRRVSGTAFVSLLGGLTRSLAANPYDVIHRLAQKTGAEAYLMPVPLFADSAADKRVMMSQSIMREAVARLQDATLAIVGIGDLETSGGSLAVAGEGAAPREQLIETGAVAELLGQFVDADGAKVAAPVVSQPMAMPLDDLRGREVVALAGGDSKTDAIRAVLKSGLLTGLLTDEATARRLVGVDGGADAVAAQ
ncbi:MAG: sugar-binding domain-containing protein [Pseudomonadota bacterium]